MIVKGSNGNGQLSRLFHASMENIREGNPVESVLLIGDISVSDENITALWEHASDDENDIKDAIINGEEVIDECEEYQHELMQKLAMSLKYENSVKFIQDPCIPYELPCLVVMVYYKKEHGEESSYLQYIPVDDKSGKLNIEPVHIYKRWDMRADPRNYRYPINRKAECVRLSPTTGELILFQGTVEEGARCMIQNGIPTWVYFDADDLCDIDLPSLHKLEVYTTDDSEDFFEQISSLFSDRCDCLGIARWNADLEDYEWVIDDPDSDYLQRFDADEQDQVEDEVDEVETMLPVPSKSFEDYLDLIEVPDGFIVKNNGIWVELENDKGGVKKVRISHTGIIVVGLARTEHQASWMKLLVWTDVDGVVHEQLFPSEVVSSFKGVKDTLASFGCDFTPHAEKFLREYLIECRPTARYRLVKQTGWYTDSEDRNLFALPYQTLGHVSGEQIHFHPDSLSNCNGVGQKGSLGNWQKYVAKPLSGNPWLIFTLSAAFASPLLRLVGGETGGFHIYGQTSRGKTTAMLVAASVWGNAAPPSNNMGKSFINTWKTTANALEAVAAGRNDILLILDEIGQAEGDNVAKTIYDLCSGMGKERMGRNTNLLDKKGWREIFLSTGELSAREAMERSSSQVKGGQLIRLIDLDIENGIVQETHNQSPMEFVDSLRAHCASHYGWAGSLFVEKLIEMITSPRGEKQLVEEYEECCNILSSGEMQSEQYRVVKRFALVLLGGVYAVRYGIVPLDKDEVISAVESICFRWLQTAEPLSDNIRAIENIRDFLAINSARFHGLDAGGSVPAYSVMGYRKRINGDLFYLFPAETFTKAVKSSNHRSLLRELSRLQLLHKNNGTRNQARFNIPSGRGENDFPKLPFYAINARILDYGQPASERRGGTRVVKPLNSEGKATWRDKDEE